MILGGEVGTVVKSNARKGNYMKKKQTKKQKNKKDSDGVIGLGS